MSLLKEKMEKPCHPELVDESGQVVEGQTFFVFDCKMVFDKLRLTGNLLKLMILRHHPMGRASLLTNYKN